MRLAHVGVRSISGSGKFAVPWDWRLQHRRRLGNGPKMKPEPVTLSEEVLAGLVERVTYHNVENGFCVLRAKPRGRRDVVTVVGHAATIAAGEWIAASGQRVNDRTHGQQFKARFRRTSPPTSAEGIEKYLSSGMIRGVGPIYASKLVRAFGEKVFDIIEEFSAPAEGGRRHRVSARRHHRQRLRRQIQSRRRPQARHLSAHSASRDCNRQTRFLPENPLQSAGAHRAGPLRPARVLFSVVAMWLLSAQRRSANFR